MNTELENLNRLIKDTEERIRMLECKLRKNTLSETIREFDQIALASQQSILAVFRLQKIQLEQINKSKKTN
mgnify:CR=1 FL=1